MDNKGQGLRVQIKEMRKTSKGRAILKLIGWSIFFAFISIVMIIFSSINKNKYNKDLPIVNFYNKIDGGN